MKKSIRKLTPCFRLQLCTCLAIGANGQDGIIPYTRERERERERERDEHFLCKCRLTFKLGKVLIPSSFLRPFHCPTYPCIPHTVGGSVGPFSIEDLCPTTSNYLGAYSYSLSFSNQVVTITSSSILRFTFSISKESICTKKFLTILQIKLKMEETISTMLRVTTSAIHLFALQYNQLRTILRHSTNT